ncbi:phosphoenolpyruvate carboxylase [Lignipirellula cremea]|uniref:Phosphoenolpyruvate carboxylase n=1 Tax=Lignipirellula cremea TaxID=2528010 RepID=A0A518DL03_9BACT|nr:phosphoenolpyruvate carboxylase [Lignipirellula cremea]QDU92517.1 Phosphoenolpyruvate carboxylase [Lignipirellula cremea]
MSSGPSHNAVLRQEINELGELLGDILRQLAGEEQFQIVEKVRHLARRRREGDRAAEKELATLLAELEEETLRVVIRAFSIFLDLSNLAEDRQRVRVLRRRVLQDDQQAYGESIVDAVTQLAASGASAGDMQRLLDQTAIELVFTAHPTEAKRRSVRSKLRAIRESLDIPAEPMSPREQEQRLLKIQAELAKLWMTDVIRPSRPTVLQEVQRGLSIRHVLWETTPRIFDELRQALRKVYPDVAFRLRHCITFGSWIGGDRDGHPGVTTAITEQTFTWLRLAAIDLHQDSARKLARSLSLSNRQANLGEELPKRLQEAIARWPQLESILEEVSPYEIPRCWLSVIDWRLEQTKACDLSDADTPLGAYASAAELADDVSVLHASLSSLASGALLSKDLADWLDRIGVFGFHLAKLDVRQHSQRFDAVIQEVQKQADAGQAAAEESESDRCKRLVDGLANPLAIDFSSLSSDSQETWALFRLLQRVRRKYGPDALGGIVISMATAPSDVLGVLWLWRQTSPSDDRALQNCPPIMPLFETISDLKQAPESLEALLGIASYREILREQGDRQTIMLGYSDSTKDGGYLSACWSLYRCQQKLYAIAAQAGVKLTFFHGRGGSLGRGGGPAARSILSLPSATFHGSLRLTEQGEVLAERYDEPAIAHRHLEQVLWSCLLAAGLPRPAVSPAWQDLLQSLADSSLTAYREFTGLPGFVSFFRKATPIAQIEQLPIGSRPSRRQGGMEIRDLRAIPWVFSWTQARCLVPAWYGLGSAIESACADPAQLALLRTMYQEWPFFQATIDNAELALSKSDLAIAQLYAQLAQDSKALISIGDAIAQEFAAARRAVLLVNGQEQLLDGTPWLQESIQARNRYIDPLNLIQIELLRRRRDDQNERTPEKQEELDHLLALTIKGLAAGMRTTG